MKVQGRRSMRGREDADGGSVERRKIVMSRFG